MKYSLIWASMWAAKPLCDVYFVLKWARRAANMLNRGASPDDPYPLWPCLAPTLARWVADALADWTVVTLPPADDHWVLFTDASGAGWGAVLCGPQGEVFAAGDRWPLGSSAFSVAELEARAVTNGVRAFAELLSERPAAALRVKVDNTSVLAGLVRGAVRSAHLARDVSAAHAALAALARPVDVGYVGTKENPADPVSRGRPLTTTSDGAPFYERGGEVRSARALPGTGLTPAHLVSIEG